MTLEEKKGWIIDRDMALGEMDLFSIFSLPSAEELNLVSDVAIKCYDYWKKFNEHPQHQILERLATDGVSEDFLNAAGELFAIASDASFMIEDDPDFADWVLKADMQLPSSFCVFKVLSHIVHKQQNIKAPEEQIPKKEVGSIGLFKSVRLKKQVNRLDLETTQKAYLSEELRAVLTSYPYIPFKAIIMLIDFLVVDLAEDPMNMKQCTGRSGIEEHYTNAAISNFKKALYESENKEF